MFSDIKNRRQKKKNHHAGFLTQTDKTNCIEKLRLALLHKFNALLWAAIVLLAEFLLAWASLLGLYVYQAFEKGHQNERSTWGRFFL